MTTPLLYALCAIFFGAMTVVAWTRWPRRSDDYHLHLGRYLFPACSVIFLLIVPASQPPGPLPSNLQIIGWCAIPADSACLLWAVVETRRTLAQRQRSRRLGRRSTARSTHPSRQRR